LAGPSEVGTLTRIFCAGKGMDDECGLTRGLHVGRAWHVEVDCVWVEMGVSHSMRVMDNWNA